MPRGGWLSPSGERARRRRRCGALWPKASSFVESSATPRRSSDSGARTSSWPAPKTRMQIALAEQATGDWISPRGICSRLYRTMTGITNVIVEGLKGSLADRFEAHTRVAQDQTNSTVHRRRKLRLSGALTGKRVLGSTGALISGDLEIEIRASGYSRRVARLRVTQRMIHELVIDLNASTAPIVPIGRSPAVIASAVHLHGADHLGMGDPRFGRRRVGHRGRGGHVEHDLNATHHNAECIGNGRSADPVCTGYVDRANAFETVAIAGYVGAGLLGELQPCCSFSRPRKRRATTSTSP